MVRVALDSAPSADEVVQMLAAMHAIRPDTTGYYAFTSVSPMPDGTGDMRVFTWLSGDTSPTVSGFVGAAPHSIYYVQGRTKRPVLDSDVTCFPVTHVSTATVAMVLAASKGEIPAPAQLATSTLRALPPPRDENQRE